MRVSLLSIVGLCLAACDPLVGTDYTGEPVLRLRGVMSSAQDDGSTIGAKGAALWQTTSFWGQTDFTPLPMTIEFPDFWLDLLSLPHDEVLFQLDPGEPAIAEAYLHIVKPDAGAMPHADDFMATDYDHALVYVSAQVPAGVTAVYLGAALAPGFHLLTRTAVSDLTTPQQALVERCVALATGGPPDRIRASCVALHLYRLDPTPDDLATLLRFLMKVPSV
jgi:hypothetical protein